MNKIVLMVMGLLFIFGGASAYYVNIDAPETVTIGKPLIVTGTTTLGIGTPIDVSLYYQLTTSTRVGFPLTTYVMADKTFRVVFDTTNLKKGTYKVEVPSNGLGDSSIPMRLVNLVDRSDEISLSSPTQQYYNGKLYVAGTLSTDASSGFQIVVFDPDNAPVFGPSYVNTNYLGAFSADIPISQPGDYEVSFTDSKGYVGSRIITVVGDVTVATTIPTTVSILSAHGKASRDNPVYFIVKPSYGTVTIHTSSSIDWVIEYVDELGIPHIVNRQGELNPEEIKIAGKGKPIYVKVYPYKYSVTSEAFLYVENANTVSVSPTVPAAFGTPTTSVPAETQQSPISPFFGLLAGGVAGYVWNRWGQ